MRWMVTDPAGQYWSPYVGIGNNPISFVDLDGRFSKIGAKIYNFINGNKGYIVDSGNGNYNVNFLDGTDGIRSVTNYKNSGWGKFSAATRDWDVSDLIPVAGSVGLNFNISALFFTVDMTPITIGRIWRGPDNGTNFSYTDAGGGGSNGGLPGAEKCSASVNGSVEGTLYFYLGDINNFNKLSLGGKRTEINVSIPLNPVVSTGGGLIIGQQDIFGGRMIGIKAVISAGAGGGRIPFNINNGRTVIH